MTSRPRVLLLLIGLLTTALLGSASRAPAAEYVPGELLVKFKPSVRTATRSSMRQAIGASMVHDLQFISAEHLKVQGMSVEEAVARLKTDPRVEYAEPNYILHADLTPNDPLFAQLYGMQKIHAPNAWDTFTGDPNLLLGVIDTGIDYNHPDLAANAWTNPGEIPGNGIDDDGNGYIDDVHGYDFVNNDGDPFDDHCHGTHCSGTIGGVGDNGVGVTGVNWHVKIAGIKFLDASGSGSTANAILSVQYAIVIGCRLTSNSWGGGGFSQGLLDAINAAGAAGQLFVAAQGNASTNTDVSPSYPAAYDSPYIIGVAATDSNDQLASFSNYGLTTCDLGAPGVDILSCQPGGGYQLLSGTSMACPHVAGACAFMFGRFPGMTNMLVKQRLMQFADPIPALAGRCVTGGRLNLFLASADPDSLAPGAVTDLATENPGSNTMGVTFTAPDDDAGAMTGRVSTYDLRYSTSPIDDGNFAGASPVSTGNPNPYGTTEHITVPGLSTSTLYYFALKSADEFGNTSDLSNIASGTTLPPPDISVAPLSLEETLTTGATASQDITISNNSPGVLDWSIPRPVVNGALSVIHPPMFTGKGENAPVGLPVVENAGGPDTFGYRWVDSDEAGGPAFAWADIAQPGNLVPGASTDDSNGGPVNIGFNFPFYGNQFSTVRVCSNGWLSFTDTGTAYANQLLPNPSAPLNLVAPFWDDLNPGGTSHAYAVNDGSRFIVSWVASPYYSGSGDATFQAILYPSGEIRFQYLSITGTTTSATVGIQNADGTVALQVAANQPYIHDNLAVSIKNIPQWLTSSPMSGSIPPGGSAQVAIGFDAAGLGTGDYPGEVHVLSNDPDSPDVLVSALLHVNGAADITSSATSLDFGSLFVNGTATRQVTIGNGGTDPLDVTGITSDDAQFVASPTSFTLAPGAAQVVSVDFTPTAAATFNSTLHIASNDPDENPFDIAMTGTGTNAPVAGVSPGSLRGATANGIGAVAETKTKDLTIQNTGGSPLDWSAVVFQGVVPPIQQQAVPINVQLPKGQDYPAGEPVTQASGGPDAYGYRWRDSNDPGGPPPAFVDISGVGTALTFSSLDDGNSTGNALPFPFSFYGNTFNSINVCTNGWASFTATSTEYTNASLPNVGTAVPKNLLAPFWDDMDLRISGSVYTYFDGNRFIVMWKDVQHYLGTAGAPTYTYELILYPNGVIEYQYQAMNGDLLSNTVGIQNADGTVGLQAAFNAALVTSNYAIRFSRRPDWLSMDSYSGTVPAGGSATVHATMSALQYPDGDYDGECRFATNDPVTPSISVPVHMHVGVGSATIAMVPRTLSAISLNPEVDLDVLAPGAPEAIDPASLLANGGAGVAPGTSPSFPGNGHGIFKVRVLDLLPVVADGRNVPLSAIGEVTDETWFSGATTINVIKPVLIAGPFPAYGSSEPAFRGTGGTAQRIAWLDPEGVPLTGYTVSLSLDGGDTWALQGSVPSTTHEFYVQMPMQATDNAMIELVAVNAGEIMGSWLSKPFTILTGTTDVGPAIPQHFALRFAGRNPVVGSAGMALALPQTGPIAVRVYDVRGALVKTLAEGTFEAGTHSVQWDGDDVTGRRVGAGVYFVKAVSGRNSEVVRLTLIH